MQLETVRGDPTLPIGTNTRCTTRALGVAIEDRGRRLVMWRSGWRCCDGTGPVVRVSGAYVTTAGSDQFPAGLAALALTE